MPKTIPVHAGQILRVKRMTVVEDGFITELTGPPGRHLVTLVLGVSDKGVPFDVVAMLDALGFVPKKEDV